MQTLQYRPYKWYTDMYYCTPVSSLHCRSFLRSSARGYLVVPRVRTSTAQSRSFAIVGPNSWNRLPQSLRTDLFSISFDQFRQRLLPSVKTFPYSLHPKPHDRIVPQVENLRRKTFLTRILYNSYFHVNQSAVM